MCLKLHPRRARIDVDPGAIFPTMSGGGKRTGRLVQRTGPVPETVKHLFPTRVNYADIRGERELELVRRAKTGDRAAWGTLDQAHLPLVYLTVRRYFGRGVCPEDLVQEGRLGLRRALDGFDETRGVAFGTYAVEWVRHYASVYASQQCQDMRIPRKVREAYERMLRMGATTEELAASANPSDRTLAANLHAVMPPVRMNAPLPWATPAGNRGPNEVGDRIASADIGADDLLDSARAEVQRASLLRELVATLPRQQREVVTRRFPLDGDAEGETMDEIAEDFHWARADRGGKVSRQRINQIEKAAMRRLAVRVSRRDPGGGVLG